MARALAISERTVFAIILALLPLVYFYPAVFGGLALAQGDGWSANLPLRVLTGRIIANGQVPVWNPFAFGGMPLLGDIYAGSLYPANWLFALLPPGFAMNAVVITTYHIALIGTYLFARKGFLALTPGDVAGGVSDNPTLYAYGTFSRNAYLWDVGSGEN